MFFLQYQFAKKIGYRSISLAEETCPFISGNNIYKVDEVAGFWNILYYLLLFRRFIVNENALMNLQ